MSNKFNSYDDIKGMLNKMRGLNENFNQTKEVITEDVTPQTEPGDDIETDDTFQERFDNVEVINDVEVKLISPDKEDIELKEDEKQSISQLIDNFRQQVNQLADLDPGFTIEETQIRLDGSISDLEINFVFMAGDDNGLFVNSDMLPIEDDTMLMIDKLIKFKPTFISAMEPLIRDRKTT